MTVLIIFENLPCVGIDLFTHEHGRFLFTNPLILSNYDKSQATQDCDKQICVLQVLQRVSVSLLIRLFYHLLCKGCLAFVRFWREYGVAIVYFGFRVLFSLLNRL